MKSLMLLFFCTFLSLSIQSAHDKSYNKSVITLLSYEHKKWMILLSSIADKNCYGLLSSYAKSNPKGFPKTALDLSKKIGFTYTPDYLKTCYTRQKQEKSNLTSLQLHSYKSTVNIYPLYVEYQSLKKLREKSPKSYRGHHKMDHRWFPLRLLIRCLKKGDESIEMGDKKFDLNPELTELLTHPLFPLPQRDRS